jgi:hypothetical protein
VERARPVLEPVVPLEEPAVQHDARRTDHQGPPALLRRATSTSTSRARRSRTRHGHHSTSRCRASGR